MVVGVDVKIDLVSQDSNRPVFLMEATDQNGNRIDANKAQNSSSELKGGEIKYEDDVSAGNTTSSSSIAYFAPTITPEISYENAGNVDVVTDNCGRTETRKNGNKNWDITVKSSYGFRPEIKRLMAFEGLEKRPRVTTDLFRGNIEIQDISVTQSTNANLAQLNTLPTQFELGDESPFVGSDETVRIYDYQIQLKQSTSEGQ